MFRNINVFNIVTHYEFRGYTSHIIGVWVFQRDVFVCLFSGKPRGWTRDVGLYSFLQWFDGSASLDEMAIQDTDNRVRRK